MPLRFRRILQHLQSCLPACPPVVVDQDWGEYAEAKEFVLGAKHRQWTRSEILENRSTLTFLNNAAFLFMLPYFLRAAWASGRIDYDILDAIEFNLYARLVSRPSLELTSPQRQALAAAIQFSHAQLDAEGIDSYSQHLQKIEARLLDEAG